MAIRRRYTQPLQVVATADMRTRIKAIADREGVSQASVIRDILDAGIERREQAR